jgi:hypothetical protein
MGFRVDNVKVVITVMVEFEGSHDIVFEFVPKKQFGFDLDPLVQALLDKNTELTYELIAKAGPADPMIFL